MTMGEPAGIGPELALKVWLEREVAQISPFVLIASKVQMLRCAKDLGCDVVFQEVETAADAQKVFHTALPILTTDVDCEVSPGDINPAAAPCIIASIKQAVHLAMTAEVSGIVTNPIHKKNLYKSGFSFPGHTEYLAHLSAPANQPPPLPVMMLQGGGLRTVPVTIHMALAQVPDALTTDLIVATAKIVHRDLIKRFGIEKPRLVVTGLNPHAGEQGTLGNEDIMIIEPAIAHLKSCGLEIRGPLSADTLFHARARKQYDVALCMYHDQALIPVKTLGFDTGVNITLGLDFIRTSPDHGTALDIAGQGIADPGSLRQALKTAAQMADYTHHHVRKKRG